MSGHHPHEETTSSPYAARIRAIEALLLEKGILTEPEVQDRISYMEARSPANGAKLVARAWIDDEFKGLLLSDGKTAASQLGMDPEHPAEFVVVQNTPKVHNLIVCTLCSCYPRAILGRPPDWYKSFEYRSRSVREPRAVMREFGFEPPEMSRSSSTTAPQTSATWSSLCAHQARRIWTKKVWPGSSRATPWSGLAYPGHQERPIPADDLRPVGRPIGQADLVSETGSAIRCGSYRSSRLRGTSGLGAWCMALDLPYRL